MITTVDRPVGRKQVMTPSDVKKYAWRIISLLNIQRVRKRDILKLLISTNRILLFVKAFGEIVPKEFLEYPKYSCINIHFSILPKYRGAVPIQKAILDVGEGNRYFNYVNE